jgi:diaminopimelate decarboxylase
MNPSAITQQSLTADARTQTHARRCAALRRLVELGHLSRGGASDDDDDDDGDDETPTARPSRDLAALIDLDALETGACHLQHSAGFPSINTLHTFAVKANPCEGVLRAFAALGFGAEVASGGELEAALAAGFAPASIVFDSPSKTRAELRRALRAGVRVNVDSLAEIERVAAILEGGGGSGGGSSTTASVIGVRVNPQVGAGSIAALSTSTDDSKFGVPIGDEDSSNSSSSGSSERAALAAAFRQHAWLRALHLHVGSQGLPLDTVAEGAARAWAFYRDELPPGRLVAFDIGGGTPVDFSRDDGATPPPPPSSAFSELARLLRSRVPELWAEGAPLLITENGRALVAKAGCAVARVEYVKHDCCEGDEGEKAGAERRRRRPIAVCHAGADLFMRACYLPAQWSMRLFIVDGRSFEPRELQQQEGDKNEWRLRDVAGPLCFQGDRLAVARPLPPIRQGDWVVIPDAGAYCLSMWSHYNSRQSPALWGYRGDKLELLRRGDTLGDVLAFWRARGGGGEGGGGGGGG